MNIVPIKKTPLVAAILAGISATPVYSASVSLEEIIVTARRVEESIQDVPISMTVYSQEEISNRNITIATDLATYTPSLSVNERYGPEKAAFSIRGFNQDQSTAPTVGVYFADVVGVRAQGGTTSGNSVGAGAFMDLQNVQVLKGPQGTLFGRNTDGGAILLVPNKPTEEFGGYLEGSVGNYDMTRLQAALNIPVSDTFRLRFAADVNQRDGYMENRSGTGPDAYNDRDYEAFRVSAVWDITDNIENYTIFHTSNSETAGYGARYLGCDRSVSPDAIGQVTFPRDLVTMAACDQIDRHNARGDGNLTVDIRHPNPSIDLEQWQIINTTTWEVNDSLTIKNILSYGEFEEHSRFALYSDNVFIPDNVRFLNFGFPAPVTPGAPFSLIDLDFQRGEANSQQKTWTEELQLQGELADGRLTYVIGGYLEFSEPTGFNGGVTGIFTDCDDPASYNCDWTTLPLAPNVSQSTTKFDFENHGVFAQGTYDVTEQLALTLGVRYTFDKIEGYDESIRVGPAPFTTSPLIATCRDAFRFPGKVITNPSECGKTLSEESDEPTWLINLDYKPNSNTLLFAKYARGYRQGGINFTNPGIETWKPEQVDNYEIGAKFSLDGSVPGFFNIAYFYNDYTDQQIFGALVSNTPGVSGGAAIINAGESEISGIEIDASFLLFDRLTVSAAYTYLDTEVVSLDASGISLEGTPFGALIPRAIEGGPLNLAPENKYSITASYAVPLDDAVGDLSVSLTFTHSDDQVLEAFSPATTGIAEERDLLNLNLNWNRVGGSSFDMALFGTNITDEEYRVATGGGYASFGIEDALYGEPRMYGMRVRYNFGE